MIELALALMLAQQPQTGPWAKYQSGPQKLILTWPQGGVMSIDYPNWDRCQRAAEAVAAERLRRIKDVHSRPPSVPGTITVGEPWTVYAFCIPG